MLLSFVSCTRTKQWVAFLVVLNKAVSFCFARTPGFDSHTQKNRKTQNDFNQQKKLSEIRVELINALERYEHVIFLVLMYNLDDKKHPGNVKRLFSLLLVDDVWVKKLCVVMSVQIRTYL